MFEVSLTKNKLKILSFLNKDIIWNSFAICDLEEHMDDICEWYIAEENDEIQSICLIWKGAYPPVLQTFGKLEGIELILSDLFKHKELYLMIPNEHLNIIEKYYKISGLIQMSRFFITPLFLKRAAEYVKPGLATRLNESHIYCINELYSKLPGSYWDMEQFKNGIFYGIFDNNKLIAAIGTHIFSLKFKISAVGNLFILPEYRKGLSYPSQLAAHLCTNLKHIGIEHIIWNSRSESRVAKLYKFWGGEMYCKFVHGNCQKL